MMVVARQAAARAAIQAAISKKRKQEQAVKSGALSYSGEGKKGNHRIQIISDEQAAVRQPPSLEELEPSRKGGSKTMAPFKWNKEYNKSIANKARTSAACIAADAASFAAYKCMEIDRITDTAASNANKIRLDPIDLF